MLEAGLESRTLGVDTRLRDALRATDANLVASPTPDLTEQMSYAEDTLLLAQRDSTRTIWRLEAEIESLRRRVALMEGSRSWRATAPVRKAWRLMRRG